MNPRFFVFDDFDRIRFFWVRRLIANLCHGACCVHCNRFYSVGLVGIERIMPGMVF